MSITEAEHLRAEWQKKGNPPCEHPAVRPERYDEAGRTCTGDRYCTICGKLV